MTAVVGTILLVVKRWKLRFRLWKVGFGWGTPRHSSGVAVCACGAAWRERWIPGSGYERNFYQLLHEHTESHVGDEYDMAVSMKLLPRSQP